MVNLNEVFPPALAPVRNRNIELSVSDKVIIGKIINSIDGDKSYTWKKAIGDLSPVMKTYNNPAGSNKGLGGNIKYLPLELIQIIQYGSSC